MKKRLNNFKEANTGRMLPALTFSQLFFYLYLWIILRKGDINVWAPFTLFFPRYKHTLHLKKQHAFIKIVSILLSIAEFLVFQLLQNIRHFCVRHWFSKQKKKTLRTALKVGLTCFRTGFVISLFENKIFSRGTIEGPWRRGRGEEFCKNVTTIIGNLLEYSTFCMFIKVAIFSTEISKYLRSAQAD